VWNRDRCPEHPANCRRLVGGIFEVSLVNRRLALKDRIHRLRRDIAVLFVVQQRRGVLPIKNHDINRVSGVSKAVEDDSLFDRITIRQVSAEGVDEVLLVDLAHVAIVRNALRRFQLCGEEILFGRECRLEEGFPARS